MSQAMLEDVDERDRVRQSAIMRAQDALTRLKPEEAARRAEQELQQIQKDVTDLRQVLHFFQFMFNMILSQFNQFHNLWFEHRIEPWSW